MTGANEGQVPQEPRTEFPQLQVLFELATAVNRAQEQSEICRAADRAAVLIIAPVDALATAGAAKPPEQVFALLMVYPP